MKPKKAQVKRKPVEGRFGFIPQVGHTWECDNCGAKEFYSHPSPYNKTGILRLASKHNCNEERVVRKDHD